MGGLGFRDGVRSNHLREAGLPQLHQDEPGARSLGWEPLGIHSLRKGSSMAAEFTAGKVDLCRKGQGAYVRSRPFLVVGCYQRGGGGPLLGACLSKTD